MNISHNQIFWRLMWKEYRSQRGLWIGVAVLAVFVQAVMLAVLRNEREVIASLYGVAWFLPILYALASSAVLFAAEKEDGTFELLRTLPVTPLRLFVGKMSFCLVTCVGMILLLNALAWIMASGNIPSLDWRDATNLAEFFPAVLVVGVFFSLMMNRVLNVLVATILTVMVLNLNDMHLVKWTGIAAFLLADVWLVRRWFLDGSLVQERIGELVSHIPLRVPFLRTAELAHAKAETSPLWWRTWKRALWLEYRHARRTIFVWFPLALLLIAISRATYNFIGVDFSYIIVPIAPLFLGLAVFRGHQQEGRIRFLTEQGVPPQLVWANAQLVWGSIVAVLLIVIAIFGVMVPYSIGGIFSYLADRVSGRTGIGAYDRDFAEFYEYWRRFGFMLNQDINSLWHEKHRQMMTAKLIGFYAWWAVLSYLAGQLCSLKFSRTVVATVAAIVLATLGFIWLSLMKELPVPFALGVMPILLFWLGLSFFGLRRWSLGVTTTGTKLRTAGLFIGFHALHLLAVISFRISEVPPSAAAEAWAMQFTGLNDPARQMSGAPSDKERLYIEADGMIASPLLGTLALQFNEPTDETIDLAQADAKWFADHQAALPLLVEAIRAKTVPNTKNLSKNAIWEFRDLLRQSAKQLIAAGELDAALTRMEDMLQFAELMATTDRLYPHEEYSADHGRRYGLTLQQNVYTLLMSWAARLEQTPAGIRQAIGLTARYESSYDSIEQAWQNTYRQTRDYVVHERDERNSPDYLAFRRLPWEQTRLLRIMDREAYAMADRLDKIKQREVLTDPRWQIPWSTLIYDRQVGDDPIDMYASYAKDGIAHREV
ncbi:MAG: ABC transporter permease, partial [Planctomycetaceae bacterium]